MEEEENGSGLSFVTFVAGFFSSLSLKQSDCQL